MASYNDILNNYFGGNAQAYAEAISSKAATGQQLSNPQAAQAFQQANPQYFGGSNAPSAPAQPTYNAPASSAPANVPSYQQGSSPTSRIIDGVQYDMIPTNVRSNWRPGEAYYPEVEANRQYTGQMQTGQTSTGQKYNYNYTPTYVYTDPRTGQTSIVTDTQMRIREMMAQGGMGQFNPADYQRTNRDMRSFASVGDWQTMINDPAMRNPETGFNYGSVMDRGRFFELNPGANELDYRNYSGQVFQGQSPEQRQNVLNNPFAQATYDDWFRNYQMYGDPTFLRGQDGQIRPAGQAGQMASPTIWNGGYAGGTPTPQTFTQQPMQMVGGTTAQDPMQATQIANWFDRQYADIGGYQGYVSQQQERYNKAAEAGDTELMQRLVDDSKKVGYQLNTTPQPVTVPETMPVAAPTQPQPYQDMIETMFEEQRRAELEALKTKALQQQQALDFQRGKIDPQFQKAMTDVDVQNQLAARRLAELMGARGMGTGDTAQGMLQQNISGQQQMSNLEAQKQAALGEISQQELLQQLGLAGEQQSLDARLNADRMQALINARQYEDDYYFRQRNLEMQEQQLELSRMETLNNIATDREKLEYQKERDKIADAQFQMQFDEDVRRFGIEMATQRAKISQAEAGVTDGSDINVGDYEKQVQWFRTQKDPMGGSLYSDAEISQYILDSGYLTPSQKAQILDKYGLPEPSTAQAEEEAPASGNKILDFFRGQVDIYRDSSPFK